MSVLVSFIEIQRTFPSYCVLNQEDGNVGFPKTLA